MNPIQTTRGALLLSAAVLASGCGGDRPDRSYAGMPEFCREALPRVDRFFGSFEGPTGERFGGTAVVGGVGAIAGGMHSLLTVDHSAGQHHMFVNLMPLLRYDDSFAPAPYLARSWEVDEAESEITFHLRDDVYWHDGEPTTAYDVAFTYERVSDPEGMFPNAAYWNHYVRGREGVEVVDSFTVRIRMRPHVDYLDPWTSVAIAPRHLLEDVPFEELRNHPYGTVCPVGNGPFRFVEHRQGEGWTFARNPAFPEDLGGPPPLDRYVYRVISEPTTLLTSLLTGGIDVYLHPTPDQYGQIEGSSEHHLLSFPFRDYVFVAWNTRRPQLADARVRRAITLATNRTEMVQAILGEHGVVANSGLSPLHWAYDEASTERLSYDPERAARLLDEAGWVDRSGDGIRESADGTRLEVSLKYNQGNWYRQQVAEIMQAQLARVGIAARPQVLEWTTIAQQITDPSRRDFDGVVLGFTADFRVDDTGLLHSSRVDSDLGFAGLQDEALDGILEALPVARDRDEARALWRAYEDRLEEIQPFTYIYFARRAAGVNDRLRGVHMDARGEWVSIAQWWIPPDERRGGGRTAPR